MPEEAFPLPGSSYKELSKIIQAYGTFDNEVVPSEVGQVAGIHESNVSRNNKFLVAVGILQGGRAKKITPIGQTLALALTHDISDEVQNGWAGVVKNNEFLQKIIAAVRIRKGMDESTLVSHIAYSAGQQRSGSVLAGAGAVVEILRISQALKDEGGTLVAPTTTTVTPSGERTTTSAENKTTIWYPSTSALSDIWDNSFQPGITLRPSVAPSHSSISSELPVTVSIRINVDCKPAELDSVGKKLREMLDELRRVAQTTEVEDNSSSESKPE